MAFPVVPITQPAVLNGKRNGELPDSILVDTPGQAGGPTVRLVEPAARAWRALCAAALAAGHTLKATSTVDSYRPLQVQIAIFTVRFSRRRVSNVRRWWRGVAWYLRPGFALAAVPGTSNHGDGLAVDTGEESDGDTGTERIDPATLAWLLANEQRYGWSHEVQSEPWHLHYFAGDRIPQAVLDYEAGQHPEPEPEPEPEPPEDDDMPLIITAKGRVARLKDGPTCSVLDPLSHWNTAANGVKQTELSPQAYDAVLHQVEEALGRPTTAAVEDVEAAVIALDGSLPQ